MGKINTKTPAASTKEPMSKDRSVVIAPPKFEQASILIRGTAPLVMHKFSSKAQAMIVATQEAGSVARKGKKRDPKDFSEVYHSARHIAAAQYGGWDGIPASSFRNAMISACRLAGFRMTLAKLSLFTVADGFEDDGTPLVKITKGAPEMHLGMARNQTGVIDVRARPMWQPGWEAKPTFRWDADQFSANDIANLLSRVGEQVGLCEGRPDSRMSSGCGWGVFELAL